MSLTMSVPEREAFLAGVHVGVISIEQPDDAPLTVPVWYDYDPRVGLWFITETESQKGRALAAAGRCSLVAQTEQAPSYQYVSVSGPIIDTRPAELEKHRRAMAHRYLGRELGDLYVSQETGSANRVFTMQPQRWRTVDYRKLGLAAQ